MGETCSSCCSTNKSTIDNNMANALILNEKWAEAVMDQNFVGCKLVHQSDPDAIDQAVDSRTSERAIHIAAKHKNKELIEYLCQNNVEIDAQSTYTKETALHIVSRLNDTQLIKLLIGNGADVDIKNNKGKRARDLCNKNIRREFNKSKVQAARRLQKQKKKSQNDVIMYGESVKTLKLKKLHQINNHIDTETEATKRARAKREEISSRDEFVTIFGKKVGCEVDEIGASIEKLDESARRDIWTKILRDNKSTDRAVDVKKLILTLTKSVVRKKQQQKSTKKTGNKKPDDQEIERLVSVLRRKFPRNKTKKVLKKHDFIHKMHIWLYEIHNDPKWIEQEQQDDQSLDNSFGVST